MKSTFIFLVIFSSLYAAAQSDTSSIEADSIELRLIRLPDSTAIGAPDGILVSKDMGPAGGKIISDDGRVELIFPEGALSTSAAISIQPIVNVIPNGNGKAYRFEPSGIRFQKPVEIIFHYSDRDTQVCPPELKFMALQDHKGKWEYLNYDDWDSTTKALKGHISHFSAMVDGSLMELSPVDTTLKVSKSFRLALNAVAAPGEEDELPPLPRTVAGRHIKWYVKKGPGFGTVRAIPHTNMNAQYTAPNNLPDGDAEIVLEINQTTIRTVVQHAGRWRGETRIPTTKNVATFTCKVKFYDEYKVTVSHDIKVNGGQMTDTSTFNLRISMEDRASISDIYNRMAKVSFPRSRCRAVYVNESTCVGMINVNGLKTSNIRPGSPGEPVWVDLSFKSAPLIFPVINFPPCGGNQASPTTPSAVAPFAFPMFFSFQAKNEKQYISLGKRPGATVTRPDPEDITATIEPVRDE